MPLKPEGFPGSQGSTVTPQLGRVSCFSNGSVIFGVACFKDGSWKWERDQAPRRGVIHIIFVADMAHTPTNENRWQS